MSMLRATRIVLLAMSAAFLAAASESSCRLLDPDTGEDDDEPAPWSGVIFSDSFAGTLAAWSLSVPFAPALDITTGNGIPSMVHGSATLDPTGAMTLTTFDAQAGLEIEGDLITTAPAAPPASAPQIWLGLSTVDGPTAPTIPSMAAGWWIDAAGVRHAVLNGVSVYSGGAVGLDTWHRVSVRILPGGGVEFRFNGMLEHSGPAILPAYWFKPVLTGGDGFPNRPRVDNVVVRRP